MYYNKQLGDFDCGAAASATVFGIPYPEAFELCKTKKDGTSSCDVFEVAKKLNGDSFRLFPEDELKNIWWLKNLSAKYPIYLALFIKRQNSKRGRPREYHHAVALINGKIYDPDKDKEAEIDIYYSAMKLCFVKCAIVFGKELETYGKNS